MRPFEEGRLVLAPESGEKVSREVPDWAPDEEAVIFSFRGLEKPDKKLLRIMSVITPYLHSCTQVLICSADFFLDHPDDLKVVLSKLPKAFRLKMKFSWPHVDAQCIGERICEVSNVSELSLVGNFSVVPVLDRPILKLLDLNMQIYTTCWSSLASSLTHVSQLTELIVNCRSREWMQWIYPLVLHSLPNLEKVFFPLLEINNKETFQAVRSVMFSLPRIQRFGYNAFKSNHIFARRLESLGFEFPLLKSIGSRLNNVPDVKRPSAVEIAAELVHIAIHFPPRIPPEMMLYVAMSLGRARERELITFKQRMIEDEKTSSKRSIHEIQ